MEAKTLYDDKNITLEEFSNGDYRITFFNENNHWAGDLIFNKDGIVCNGLDN